MRRAISLVFALAACRHATQQHPDHVDPPRISVSAPVEPRVEPTDAPVDDNNTPLARRLSVLADNLASRMATVRDLTVMRPIARGVMSREAVVRRLRARTQQEYPAGELELEGEMNKRLGLIPEDVHYEQTMFDLLEEQVLGFYDPDEHRLYIADWVPDEMQAPTMAHELVHALQDQHFEIARFTRHLRGHGDAQMSAMSVLEGDATAAMLDFSLAPSGRTILDLPDVTATVSGQMSSGQQPRLAAAPRALRESLLFPYIAGLRLCVERMRGGGHAAIDQLLSHPPDSTEQVIHPEKLASREVPVEIPAEIPPAMAGEFELGYHEVLGEFGTRLMLADTLTEARVQASAQGWGGDRAVLLLPRGTQTANGDHGVTLSPEGMAHSALLWTVVMDAGRPRVDGEAQELANALGAVLAHRYTQRPSTTIAGTLAVRDLGGGRVSFVATRGRVVLFGDRVPANKVTTLVRGMTTVRTP
jgi:hypothetical protein